MLYRHLPSVKARSIFRFTAFIFSVGLMGVCFGQQPIDPNSVRQLTSAELNGVEIYWDVRVPMRDGVRLAADVYKPTGPGKWPVIVTRTPYLKSGTGEITKAAWWAQHGYVFVVQDVRGRGESEGDWYPLKNETLDGFDTQTWTGSQPWSNGMVGTAGCSYMGWTQLYPAGLNNPQLKAMEVECGPSEAFRNYPITHGIVLPGEFQWLVEVTGHGLQCGYKCEQQVYDDRKVWESLPVIDWDRRFGRDLPIWRDWVTHRVLDAYWKPQLYQKALLQSRVPALYQTGWYDDSIDGALQNFSAMTSAAVDPEIRKKQWLIIGPWGHGWNNVATAEPKRTYDFGPDATFPHRETLLKWFDHWLKNEDNGLEKEPHVRLFVMGMDKWVSEQEWPIARTQYVKYFLHSGGRANSLKGDGRLSIEAPKQNEPSDHYRYDPGNPVPFLNYNSQVWGGPDDYRDVETREDVLVYTTDAFQVPTRMCGPLQVVLSAASSAKDTDWTARVLDVHPDGYVQRLNDGIVRARLRFSEQREVLLTPNKAEQYTIDAWATCVELLLGHRLRVEISSSAFPKYERNLNTGGRQYDETTWVTAQQEVLHNKEHPSYLLAPIVPSK